MKRAIVLGAALGLCCFAAFAQQPPPRTPAIPLRAPRVEIESPLPRVPQIDTTLLNDTAASGLKSRTTETQLTELSLPVGKHCVLETAQGAHYSGTLEAAGEWFAVRLDNGHGRVWIPARHIVSLLESAPDDAAK